MLEVENPASFRHYVDQPTENDSHIAQRVFDTYKQQHDNQCVDFVRKQHERWLKFDHDRMTMFEALEKLSTFIDASDPDVDIPNMYHGFQTAEALRKTYPDSLNFTTNELFSI